MKMMIFKRWSPQALKRPDPFKWALPIDEAQTMFERGDTVQAVYFIDDQPYARVSMRIDYFSVCFYDEDYNDFLYYDFNLVEKRLFLQVAIYYEYSKPGLRKSCEQDHFEPNGEHYTIRWNDEQKTVERTDIAIVDVNGLWEDYPDFGEYSSLLQFERDMFR